MSDETATTNEANKFFDTAKRFGYMKRGRKVTCRHGCPIGAEVNRLWDNDTKKGPFCERHVREIMNSPLEGANFNALMAAMEKQAESTRMMMLALQSILAKLSVVGPRVQNFTPPPAAAEPPRYTEMSNEEAIRVFQSRGADYS